MAGGLAEKISKWVLTNGGESGNIRLVREAGVLCAGSEYGGIAQLGERLNGIQEVSGSIPLISTIERISEPIIFLGAICVQTKRHSLP